MYTHKASTTKKRFFIIVCLKVNVRYDIPVTSTRFYHATYPNYGCVCTIPHRQPRNGKAVPEKRFPSAASFFQENNRPGDNFWASFGKFIAVFAPTQVPIAIAEGILTVIVYNVIQKNCVKELKELSGITVSNPNRGKLWARNLVLALGVVLLVTIPLMLLGNSEFGGSDDAGSTVVEEINGGYTPWFESFWEPPSGEVESLLFCVQSAIGAGICGFVLGRISRKPKASASEDDAALTDQKQTSAS